MSERIIPNYINFDYGNDYVNIRNRFQKGYTSIAGEPGYFYFRVFFDFKTSPLLKWNEGSDNLLRNITAQQFLYNNWNRCNCENRYYALHKFRKLLYFITKDTPWAISKVSGTGDSAFVDPIQPGKGQKSIKIEFSTEFTDFRTTLLLDLYRYIYFDSINQRVILPENLRKFNMSVMYFSVPLKWFHTPIRPESTWKDTLEVSKNDIKNAWYGNSGAGKIITDYPKYGKLTNNVNNTRELYTREYYQNTISVHMMHFLNCEISPKSTYSLFASGSSDKPFSTSGSMEISYNRAYTQDISEWFEMQMSEFTDAYSDSDKEEHLPIINNRETKFQTKEENFESGFKKILNNISKIGMPVLDNISSAILGANALNDNNSIGLTNRRRLIREQELNGALTSKSLINKAITDSIDAVTSMVADRLSLGNIYDNQLVSGVTDLINSKSEAERLEATRNIALSPFSLIKIKNGKSLGDTDLFNQLSDGGVFGVMLNSARGIGMLGLSLFNKGGKYNYQPLERLWGFKELWDKSNRYMVDIPGQPSWEEESKKLNEFRNDKIDDKITAVGKYIDWNDQKHVIESILKLQGTYNNASLDKTNIFYSNKTEFERIYGTKLSTLVYQDKSK